jgi:hypothetical protein
MDSEERTTVRDILQLEIIIQVLANFTFVHKAFVESLEKFDQNSP